MRVTLDWLRDFVELDGDTGQIAADLTTAGLEVEAVDPIGTALRLVARSGVPRHTSGTSIGIPVAHRQGTKNGP